MMNLVVQGFSGLLGPILVNEPETNRQPDDDSDDHRVSALTDEIGRERRGQQQRQQRGAQLMPQHRQKPGPVRGHRVQPPPRLPRRHLGAAQARISRDIQRAQNPLRAERARRHNPDHTIGHLRPRRERH